MWITKDNINQRINLDLFESEATTGLVTRSSQHWRYYALTYEFGPNMLDPDASDEEEDEDNDDADYQANRRASRNLRKMTEEDFPEDRSTNIYHDVIITGLLLCLLSCVVPYFRSIEFSFLCDTYCCITVTLSIRPAVSPSAHSRCSYVGLIIVFLIYHSKY